MTKAHNIKKTMLKILILNSIEPITLIKIKTFPLQPTNKAEILINISLILL
jgi:hypothetical protein